MDKGRAALLALVLQNTLLVLTMRYSRTRPGPMYLASSAVIVDEVTPPYLWPPPTHLSRTEAVLRMLVKRTQHLVFPLFDHCRHLRPAFVW